MKPRQPATMPESLANLGPLQSSNARKAFQQIQRVRSFTVLELDELKAKRGSTKQVR